MTNDKVKILVVDDEKNVLKSLERAFLDEDYILLYATSGKDALDMLEKEDGGIQVVLSDYRMPRMNGAEFLHEVCARWPQTVRLVLSGYADTPSIISSINDGHIYRFIPKPWNDDELKASVSNAIERYFFVRQNEESNRALKEKNDELTKANEHLQELLRQKVGGS